MDDVDLVSGGIAIRHTLVSVNGSTVPSSPKTARGRRVVAVDEATVDVLIEHRERCLLVAARNGVLPDLVFCRPDGDPLYPSGVSRRFPALARRAGVPRIRLHDYADLRVMPTSLGKPLAKGSEPLKVSA